jgi:hypothetical protein
MPLHVGFSGAGATDEIPARHGWPQTPDGKCTVEERDDELVACCPDLEEWPAISRCEPRNDVQITAFTHGRGWRCSSSPKPAKRGAPRPRTLRVATSLGPSLSSVHAVVTTMLAPLKPDSRSRQQNQGLEKLGWSDGFEAKRLPD